MDLKITNEKTFVIVRLGGTMVAILSKDDKRDEWSVIQSRTGGFHISLNGRHMGTFWFRNKRE